MSPELARRALELFADAVALDAVGRAALLDRAGDQDPELRREVERLLVADAQAGGPVDRDGGAERFLAEHVRTLEADESIVFDAPDGPAAAGELGGRYRILRVLGEGGMGVVYEAVQARPRRTVALKAIRPSLVSEPMLRRFEFEAETLGRLQHPGIAQIYEAGTLRGPTGVRAFFALEFVRGLPIDQYAQERNLPLAKRLELLAQVCDAVQYAHQMGVVHRDLKPANILVDEHGLPKVLDFGVARTADADPHAATRLTHAGQIIGTLPYMSPEQVAGDARAVDTRTDVYALGVILYKLLVGALPLDLTD
jgi:serine/threonine protein kinase